MCDKIAKKELLVRYISTYDQLADIFTRPITKMKFAQLRNKLSIVLSPVQLAGG